MEIREIVEDYWTKVTFTDTYGGVLFACQIEYSKELHELYHSETTLSAGRTQCFFQINQNNIFIEDILSHIYRAGDFMIDMLVDIAKYINSNINGYNIKEIVGTLMDTDKAKGNWDRSIDFYSDLKYEVEILNKDSNDKTNYRHRKEAFISNVNSGKVIIRF